MGLLVKLFQLLFNLPWWGGLAVVAGLIAAGWALALHFSRKFDHIVRDAVSKIGESLRGAQATVHSVAPAAAPEGPSPHDPSEEDEDFAEGLDGESWDEEGTNFYTIEATITPADPQAAWDPTILAMVPADFTPADPIENSTRFGALHSAEIFTNGQFEPAASGDIRGQQRLRMLFAFDSDMHAMKFAYGLQYFGRIELPAPLTCAVGRSG